VLLFCLITEVKATVNKGNIKEFINYPLDSFNIAISPTTSPPHIDGKLNDICWTKCKPYGNFTQLLPIQESLASDSTLLYMTYDSNNLYFAVKCYDPQPQKVVANLRRRDDSGEDDAIAIILDTYNNRRTCYYFLLNPLGMQEDGTKTITGSDNSWDGVWTSSGQLTSFGWQVEAAIPFKILRFSNKENQVWGIQVMRIIPRTGEVDTYVPDKKSYSNDLQAMASIYGIKIKNNQQFLDLTPYFSNNYNNYSSYKDKNKVNIGGDVKYDFSSDIIFDATVNPDFGYVEADVDYINLSPYELYLQEKRPFFLEKMEIFQTPINLFYSRRIVDPDVGIKVTGRKGKNGFGALFAQDNNDYDAHKDDYAIARYEQEFMDQSHMGVMATYVNKINDYNYTYSTDWNIIKGAFTFGGQIAKSNTKNISRLDWRGTGHINYYKNNLYMSYGHSFYERNFNAYAGFLTPPVVDRNYTPFSYRTDGIETNYSWYINKHSIRSFTPGISYYIWKDYEGKKIIGRFSSSLSLYFNKNVNISFGYYYNEQLWENEYHDIYSFSFSAWGNPQGNLGFNIYYNEGRDLDYWNSVTVWEKQLNLSFTWHPNQEIEISPSLSHISQYQYQHGPRTYNQWNELLRLGYQFNKDMFLKVFLQGNSYSDYYTANFLFGYTFLPGSTMYLAYNSNYNYTTDKRFKPENKTLFFKISVLVSP